MQLNYHLNDVSGMANSAGEECIKTITGVARLTSPAEPRGTMKEEKEVWRDAAARTRRRRI